MKLVNTSTVRPGLPNLKFLRRCLSDFAAGMQAVAVSNLSGAEQSSARFDAELWRMLRQRKDSAHMPGTAPPVPLPGPPKLAVMPDALLDPLLNTLSIMSLELRGALLAVQGKAEDAKAVFARAAKEERALGYRESPNYIRPASESEGAAMLAVRRWAHAKAAFERALVERPHSGFALYGVALASEQLGNREAAVKTYADFLIAWKDAGPGLPQIAHARAYMEAHRG